VLPALGCTAQGRRPYDSLSALMADPLYVELMPDLLRRPVQAVKLAECAGFEANGDAFEIERHPFAF